MREQETYKAAFSGVKAPADAAQKALARLQSEPVPPRRAARYLRRTAAALALAALLSVTAWAEMANGAVSNMLAPLYGGAQTELVDHIGRPLNVRASNGGYTVTADAIVGDRNTVYVVYTLRRDDGQPVPEYADFAEWENSIADRTGSNSRDSMPGENGTRVFVEECTGLTPLFGRSAVVTLTDLEEYDPVTGERTLVVPGEWKLRFTMRYEDTTETILAEGLTVTDTAGRAYTVKTLRLSALGVSLDLTTEPFDANHPESITDNFSVSVRMKDGTEAIFRTRNIGARSSGSVDYSAQFQTPCTKDTIEAIIIGDTEVPIN